MVGAEVGVRELHVGRPERAQAGFAQAGVEAKTEFPNEVIPAQYSITAI